MTETTKRIIALQKENGLNDHQLETGVGLPVSSVQAWTKGKKRKNGEIAESSPGVDSIAKLARYFNVSADYLLGLTDERRPLSATEAAQPQTTVAEKPSSEIAENFIREFKEQMKEKTFQDIAKLYKAINLQENLDRISLKAQILVVLVTYLKGVGMDTQAVVGY